MTGKRIELSKEINQVPTQTLGKGFEQRTMTRVSLCLFLVLFDYLWGGLLISRTLVGKAVIYFGNKLAS